METNSRPLACTLICAGVAMTLLTVAVSAGPNPRNDFDTCQNGSGDIAIAACNRAIGSGKFSKRNLGGLHNNRGIQYSQKHDYDRAIADFNEAIRLDPNDAHAYSNR